MSTSCGSTGARACIWNQARIGRRRSVKQAFRSEAGRPNHSFSHGCGSSWTTTRPPRHLRPSPMPGDSNGTTVPAAAVRCSRERMTTCIAREPWTNVSGFNQRHRQHPPRAYGNRSGNRTVCPIVGSVSLPRPGLSRIFQARDQRQARHRVGPSVNSTRSALSTRRGRRRCIAMPSQ